MGQATPNDARHPADEGQPPVLAWLRAVLDAAAQGYLLADDQRRIRHVNKLANVYGQRLLGRPFAVGALLDDYVLPALRGDYEDNVARVLRGETVAIERHVAGAG